LLGLKREEPSLPSKKESKEKFAMQEEGRTRERSSSQVLSTTTRACVATPLAPW